MEVIWPLFTKGARTLSEPDPGRPIGEFEQCSACSDVPDLGDVSDDSDDDLDVCHSVIFDDVSNELASLYSIDPVEPSNFKDATSSPLAE